MSPAALYGLYTVLSLPPALLITFAELSVYIRNNKPANITTPITFAFAGSFVGIMIIASGSRLNMHAHAGRDVVPVTTAIRKLTANTSIPAYPRYIV